MAETKSKSQKKRRWLYLTLSALVVLVAVGGGAAIINGRGGDTGIGEAELHTVQREPLTISVTDSGPIESRNRVVVTSQVEGQNSIIELVPEGTMVEKGELLIRLDASEFETELREEQIELQNAEAELISARENLEVVKNQTEADIAQAELDLQFAKQDLEKYTAEGGEYQMQLDQADAKIALAESELTQADDRLAGSKQLADKQYISQTELASDRLAHERAKLDLKLAKQEKRLLEDYTKPRQMAQLNSDVEQAEMALVRVKRKANADIAQAEANLTARQAEVERERASVAELERQIDDSTIEAPIAGMVVYAEQGNRWDDEVLEEGTSVRERQELIYMPTSPRMSAQVKVHESELTKVELGQNVTLTIDALPDESFSGTVVSIARAADDGGWRNPDLSEYRVKVDINEVDERLRPGMTANAEIRVAQYADALTVPIQTVLRVNDGPTVFVVDANGQPHARPIEVGLDNNRKVRVVSGLEAGEQVLMTPPLDQAEREAYGVPPDAEVTREGGSEAEAIDGDDATDAGADEDTDADADVDVDVDGGAGGDRQGNGGGSDQPQRDDQQPEAQQSGNGQRSDGATQ